MTDYYKVLGIDRSASASEIKLAFRKLALKFHPDRHVASSEHGRAVANQRFRELLEAYEVLSDEKQRQIYNRSGRAGFKYGGGAAGQDAYKSAGGAGGGYYAGSRRASYSESREGGGGPFQGSVHPRGRWSSPFLNWRWRLSINFGRADYVFHGLIITFAIIGFTTAGAAADAIWRTQNAGKSFEEAMEAVERKNKGQVVASEGRKGGAKPGEA